MFFHVISSYNKRRLCPFIIGEYRSFFLFVLFFPKSEDRAIFRVLVISVHTTIFALLMTPSIAPLKS